MNLLITSVGRRDYLVSFFKRQLNQINRKIYATDRDKYSPGLYSADNYFISDDLQFNSEYEYIEDLLNKCKMFNISYVITLHDKQLLLFSKYSKHFELSGINLIASDYEIIDKCYDKTKYKDFSINQIPTIIIKDRYGSASQGLIKQPLIEGKEYNVQCYFDLISGELVDIFMQEKLAMRAGETDKSISCWDKPIIDEVLKLCNIKGFKGAIDIDVILGDKPYIIDINPRFGGGYPLAHECGCDFVHHIIENMCGNSISNICGAKYPYNIVMMKTTGLLFREE